jgi:branched-chain amino acid transport system permease protein
MTAIPSNPSSIAGDRSTVGLAPALREGLCATLVAALLTLPLVGFRLVSDATGKLGLQLRLDEALAVTAAVGIGRSLLALSARGRTLLPMATGAVGLAAVAFIRPEGLPMLALLVGSATVLCHAVLRTLRSRELFDRSRADGTADGKALPRPGRRLLQAGFYAVVAFTLIMPMTPLADRYVLDLSILILTYLLLGWGLNIIVGLAGLLDLGYVAFYAVGAYTYALLAIHFGLSFWICLPLAAVIAALFGLLLGFPVLKLRGDYFAIVTLGFGEIIRIILLNYSTLTGGPDGLTGIPRPTFFGLADFTRSPPEGGRSFHEMFGLDFSAMHRIVFLYYVVLALALLANYVGLRLRQMPIGRAWEALREDDVACQAMGIDRTRIKLSAFMISAAFGGIAGAFFATRQGYISPESFTFTESAIILAIVVLGGMGSQVGVVLATLVLVGLPEAFRDLQQYRMLAFGAAMVLIMIWKPGGLLAERSPSLLFADWKARRRETGATP